MQRNLNSRVSRRCQATATTLQTLQVGGAQAQVDAMRGAAGLHRGRNGEQRLVVLSCTNLGYSSSEIGSTVMLGVRQRANPSIP